MVGQVCIPETCGDHSDGAWRPKQVKDYQPYLERKRQENGLDADGTRGIDNPNNHWHSLYQQRVDRGWLVFVLGFIFVMHSLALTNDNLSFWWALTFSAVYVVACLTAGCVVFILTTVLYYVCKFVWSWVWEY